jgi:signal transduction histidine kinase/DNA-binding response OmpR family regulator
MSSTNQSQHTEPTRLQGLLMDIANHFINVPLESTATAINTSLKTLGDFTEADRAYVFNYDHEHQLSSNTFEWCREGIQPQIDELQNVPYEAIPDWIEIHFSGKSLVIPDVLQLDPESGVRQILEPQDIKSLIAIPMMDGDVCTGFVGFDSVRHHHTYTEKEQQLLELFALILVNLNNRIHTQTQLNEAIAKAEAASKAKSAFLANMSHEIRTPLNGVIGFTDLLKNTTLDATQQQYVAYANAAGHTLLSIINDILDFSKIEAGMMPFERIRSNLVEVIEQSIDVVRVASAEKGIPLRVELPEELPPFIWTDPVRLKQIFINLLNNGVKFTENGEVVFSVTYEPLEANQGRFVFAVRDTGIGITDEQKAHLFQAFSQADSSTTRKYGGTGLGLVISDMIARNLGSKILIDNQHEQGTTFYFELITQTEFNHTIDRQPSVKATTITKEQTLTATTINQSESTQTDSGSPNQRRVLIVEDVTMNRLMIRAQLEILIPGAHFIEAENGLEAIACYQRTRPDLIMMDIHMPEMDGIEATRTIRRIEHSAGLRVPIIALTADAFVQQQETCLAAGMDYFLTKPLDSVKLRDIVSKVLKAPTPVIHFEQASLLERCGNKKELVAKLIAIVLDDLPKQLTKLTTALDQNQLEDLWKTAHKIKGTALNLNLPALKEIAASLEQKGRNSDAISSEMKQLVDAIYAEWIIVEPLLKNNG